MVEKAIIIGLDGVIPGWIERFIKEGRAPHTEELIKRGVSAEAIPCIPAATATNWTTIATGAWPGTHGIAGGNVTHLPGEPLDRTHTGFREYEDAVPSEAEYLWDAVERAGKKCIIIKYPVGWPPTIRNGIVVHGRGGGPGRGFFEVLPNTCFSTIAYRGAIKVELSQASGWSNLPQSHSKPLETEISLTPTRHGGGQGTRYRILIIDSRGKGYDRVLICRSKDAGEAVTELSVGEWSRWIYDGNFKVNRFYTGAYPTEEGKQLTVTYRFKLIELSPDGRRFTLYCSEVEPTEGFTYPPSIAKEIIKNVGPIIERQGYDAYRMRWIDDETFMDLQKYEAEWMANAATYLMRKYDWNLLMMQVHHFDYAEHLFLKYVDPVDQGYDAERYPPERYWSMLKRDYEFLDEMIGAIIDEAGEDTLIVVVGDHGQCPVKNMVNVEQILADAGLINFEIDVRGQKVIDWSSTKAYPTMPCNIFVNLEGRDPDGIVREGEEYERVRDQIIDALYNAKDPRTGERLIALAMRREDAKSFGLYGDRVGDVIYMTATGYGGGHGTMMPTAKIGTGSYTTVLIMAGPGVKEGIRISRPVWLTSVAPTVAYLLGVPMPAQAEGAILYEALETATIREK